MKVIVTKYLNARMQLPATSSENPFFRSPGEVLNIDQIIPGTPIEGNAVWYRCADDGCYYWSGGTAAANEILTVNDRPYVLEDIQALKIYQSAVSELYPFYQFLKGFKGLAAGFKQKDDAVLPSLALIFYVQEKSNDVEAQIPAQINYHGYQLVTDIQKQNGVVLLSDEDKQPPFPMGGSVSEITAAGNFRGTRSLLVRKDGVDYLMTCYHVACGTLFREKRFRLASSQQVEVNVPSPAAPQAASPVKLLVKEGGFGPTHDYALIAIKDIDLRNTLPDRSIINWYRRDELPAIFKTDTTLEMYGAISKTASGQFLGYHADLILSDKERDLYMKGLIKADIKAEKGDSGAPVVDISNNKLVGFVVAGKPGEYVYILPMAELNFYFSIEPKL